MSSHHFFKQLDKFLQVDSGRATRFDIRAWTTPVTIVSLPFSSSILISCILSSTLSRLLHSARQKSKTQQACCLGTWNLLGWSCRIKARLTCDHDIKSPWRYMKACQAALHANASTTLSSLLSLVPCLFLFLPPIVTFLRTSLHFCKFDSGRSRTGSLVEKGSGRRRCVVLIVSRVDLDGDCGSCESRPWSHICWRPLGN